MKRVLSFLSSSILVVFAPLMAALGCGGGNPGVGDGGIASIDGGDGSLVFGDGGGPPTKCSSDLHDILDMSGNILTTCPPDQGCAGGACVDACESASANKSSIGCDYFTVNPDTTFSAGACFAAFVANTWGTPVTITADFNGTSLNIANMARVPQGTGQAITYTPLTNNQLGAGQIAVLFLAEFGVPPDRIYTPSCPAGVTPGWTTSDPAPHGTMIGNAFHIATSAPVVAYDIFPYGGGQSAITSATLLLPTTAWDTNYIAVDAYKQAAVLAGDSFNQPFIAIIASADGTNVTISPTAPIVGGPGVMGTNKGVPATYLLNKGQVLQLTQVDELTGSPIQSTKPIAVVGGSQCMDVPETAYFCDAAHQQIPPVRALGHEYVAVRYRNRVDGLEESPPWHLVGAVDNTMLTYEPSAPAGAPTTLSSGQQVEFMTNGPFVVKSQDDKHPFYLAGYMTGASIVATPSDGDRGDPEFVNVIPPQEYLGSYTFFTDPTYPETNLVFVRTKGPSGFADVTLDCAGVLTSWKPADTSGKYEYTRIDLVRHNFVGQNGCNNGRHEAHSDNPFGLTVWGWGTNETGGTLGGVQVPGTFFSGWVSYAYPAGASVQPINTVVVPPAPK